MSSNVLHDKTCRWNDMLHETQVLCATRDHFRRSSGPVSGWSINQFNQNWSVSNFSLYSLFIFTVLIFCIMYAQADQFVEGKVVQLWQLHYSEQKIMAMLQKSGDELTKTGVHGVIKKHKQNLTDSPRVYEKGRSKTFPKRAHRKSFGKSLTWSTKRTLQPKEHLERSWECLWVLWTR